MQIHLQKKKVLHFVYKLSIDIQYTHKCISNQMLKLELQFYILTTLVRSNSLSLFMESVFLQNTQSLITRLYLILHFSR